MVEDEATRPKWLTPTAKVFGGALGALLLGGAGGMIGSVILHDPPVPGSCDAVTAAQKVLPSVVTVWASGATGSGNGSGAIISADGLIVTNDHVIAPAITAGTVSGAVAVTLADGELLAAELVGRDPQTDLAVLRVERDDDLPAIRFGSSAKVRTGQPVVALGAPLGQSNSVTAGIISALDRTITLPTGDGGVTVVTGMVQTDASINPGNSGGALVDCDSRLIGINTAVSTVPGGSTAGGSIGIGFAVPVDTVQAITDELIEHGQVNHPSFGIEASTLSAEAAARFGVPPGLVVTAVVAGGSADQAGIEVGDLITRIGDRSAPTTAHLASVTVRSAPGDQVDIELVRAGQALSAIVTLQPNPTG